MWKQMVITHKQLVISSLSGSWLPSYQSKYYHTLTFTYHDIAGELDLDGKLDLNAQLDLDSKLYLDGQLQLDVQLDLYG